MFMPTVPIIKPPSMASCQVGDFREQGEARALGPRSARAGLSSRLVVAELVAVETVARKNVAAVADAAAN